MVRVDSDLVLAGTESTDAVVQVVETHSEVTGIAPRRLEPETSLAKDACSHQGEEFESDEWRLLREFVRHDEEVKERFVREGDSLTDDASVVVRGGELDPVVLRADAERYFAVYGTFGISVLAVRDITFDVDADSE
jgi:hypothetical protein